MSPNARAALNRIRDLNRRGALQRALRADRLIGQPQPADRGEDDER